MELKLSVTGVPQNVATGTPEGLAYQKTLIVAGAVRGTEVTVTEVIDDNNVLHLEYADGTEWITDVNGIAELHPETLEQNRDGTLPGLPLKLRAPGAQRGLVQDIALKVVHIFVRNTDIVADGVRLAAGVYEKKVLGTPEGMYRIGADFKLQPAGNLPNGKYLLLLHGTGGSLGWGFGGLKDTPEWTDLRRQYGEDNIIGFQHYSITKSPLENAIDIIQSLPAQSEVDIVSHSRGGIIGDILARFAVTGYKDDETGLDSLETANLEKEGRKVDVERIKALRAAIKGKHLTVGTFVRVASPAAGTILASDRLEKVFNMLFNLASLIPGAAGNPIVAALKELTLAIVASKDTEQLAGIEAMNPNSPLIKVLNNPKPKIVTGDKLAIIAGNCVPDVSLQGLKIIAARLFYQTDNDMVVNTNSMYKGVKRTTTPQFYFDERVATDHGHYFINSNTRKLIKQALTATMPGQIPGFSTLTDQQTQARNIDLLGLEGGTYSTGNVSGKKPILIVLPGIMGSALKIGDAYYWVNYARILAGELTQLGMDNEDVTSDAVIRTSYKKLCEFFSFDYDVVAFPFDWRRKQEESCERFAAKIEELLAHKQQIHIVGHSMGGMLVRNFIIFEPEMWGKLKPNLGKVIFLGAPLNGSYRIPAVLFGNDAIINQIAKLDLFHSKKELTELFCNFPGILSLLPLTTTNGKDFGKLETWQQVADVLGGWGIPDEVRLEEFRTYRHKLLEGIPGLDYSNMYYIAGKDARTPVDYDLGANGRKEFTVLYTGAGDQSVTWESGIPQKMKDNNAVYYATATHGGLPTNADVMRAIKDLLRSGSTKVLPTQPKPIAPGERLFRSAVPLTVDTTEAATIATLMGETANGPDSNTLRNDTAPPLLVTVCNSDIKYASHMVLCGHFENDSLLSAEATIDKYLGGRLSEKQRLNIYPGARDTAQVFPSDTDKFKGAVVAGLGPIGALTAYTLSQAVEQGVCAYLLAIKTYREQNIYKGCYNAADLGLSSLLVGSGYGAVNRRDCLVAIIRGVQKGNEKVRAVLGKDALQVARLEFIELYEDIAQQAYYDLHKLAGSDTSQNLNIVIPEGNGFVHRFGGQKQLFTDHSLSWYKRLSITHVPEYDYTATLKLAFSLTTGGAREELKTLFTSPAITNGLIGKISTSNEWSPELARTLFELLIPNDFKEQMARQSNLTLIVDNYTAGYPWEMLQDSATEGTPLCVTAGMVRQLATDDYRINYKPVTAYRALVVGDPNSDGYAQQLPGAMEEAEKVKELLDGRGMEVVASLQKTEEDIIVKLLSNDYKVIHLSGHGLFDADDPSKCGMLIGNGVFLTALQIKQMRNAPELVFINCCYLGKVDGFTEEQMAERYQIAANLGTQLIKDGVKAVVAAGWAVNDAAALEFATVFYHQMFDGHCFGDALRAAREQLWHRYPTTNTWGAYQAYGDPYYVFREEDRPQTIQYDFVLPEQAALELENLRYQLSTGNDGLQADRKLAAILEDIRQKGFENSNTLHLTAQLYAEMGRLDRAIATYEQLFAREDSLYPLKAKEHCANLKSKWALQQYQSAIEQNNITPESLTIVRETIENSIKELLQLNSWQVTSERYALLGSANRRLAFVSADEQRYDAIAAAGRYYREASKHPGNRYPNYAAGRWLEMAVLQRELAAADATLDAEEVPTVADALRHMKLLLKDAASEHHTDYWLMMEKEGNQLCCLILESIDKGVIDVDRWQKVGTAILGVWEKAGNRMQKETEIEHLTTLAELYNSAPAFKLVAYQLALLKARLQAAL
ncbi:MAG: CHAT domain-containing protein [Chitinophagia bacterium]|nr:CHAT domain-containing protein [Chitinophagia bacterium]